MLRYCFILWFLSIINIVACKNNIILSKNNLFQGLRKNIYSRVKSIK
jgi:hypothetical protein